MNKNSKSRIKLISIFTLGFLVVVLTIIGFHLITRNKMKEDLFGKFPNCTLPCWNNITPGLTSSKEALNILQATAYIDKSSIMQVGSYDNGGCSWHWKIPGRRIPPKLDWQFGVVRQITLGLTFNLTVDEVINLFGFPEAVGIVEGGTPENWYWIVDMYYPQVGIQVKIYTPNFSSLIEPSTEVGVIIIFPPTTIEGRISELFPNLNPESMNWLFASWKGYGDIKRLYPGIEK